MSYTIIRNANIYTPIDSGAPCSGEKQAEIYCHPKGAIVIREGIIENIGPEEEVLKSSRGKDIMEEYDCEGRCVIPGFVDPHTHMCFAALREEEFAMRIGGIPYLDILAAGGGILSSVKSVAQATPEDLAATTKKHVLRALRLGTTTLEIKSGYGLDTQNELKMLEAIHKTALATPVDIIPTFLGAHAVPAEYKKDSDAFIDYVIGQMLPAVKKQGIAVHCDIFCEKGVFSIDQSRRLLQAAISAGMRVKLHADEVNDLGGAGLAAELGALSADHLLAANDNNIEAMARAGVIAVLLPATAYSLQKPYARAREMIEKDLAVALATDCNPGSSFTESMQFVIGLAVVNMKMSPAEALTAATLNAAYAIGMQKRVGSLEIGKQADIVVLEGDSPAILAYHAGVTSVSRVLKKGQQVS